MTDQIIICPHCQREIPLTEALTHGIEQSVAERMKAEFARREAEAVARAESVARAEAKAQAGQALREAEQKIRERDERLKESAAESAERERKIKELQASERAMREERRALEARSESLDREVEEKAKEEVKRREGEIAARAAAREREKTEADLNNLTAELSEQRSRNKELRDKQAELLAREQKLADEKEELELRVKRELAEGRETIRQEAERRAAEEHKLKHAEQEKRVQDLLAQMEEMKRKAEQGSQQTQGEVQELALEETLKAAYPLDRIEPVAKGVRGADTLQRVSDGRGGVCGTIVWESKRTKAWSPGWIAKLKEDQRASGGEMAVLVSQVLPPDIQSFEYRDGVFIASYEAALPLASVLRLTLQELAKAKSAQEGRSQKVEVLYAYVTGIEFRNRVQAVIDTFSEMAKELAGEQAAFQRIWAKRAKQIERMRVNTTEIWGSIEGIMGGSLGAIESLELKSLEGPETAERPESQQEMF